MHIHLDVIGGISGNMFIAAVLNAFPDWAEGLPRQLELAGFDNLVELQTHPKNDGVLTGAFFDVKEIETSKHNHLHRPYRLIRETLQNSRLTATVKQHALNIFAILAKTEAQVHNTAIDEIVFHEVGAWDSIADVVCAAYLIAKVNSLEEPCSWSVSALPLGNGIVHTAHGPLPVPAPAVALLLKDFRFYRDDIQGERITPTGAAILRYLVAPTADQEGQQSQLDFKLQAIGQGFGSKTFAGISNVLRLLVFSFAASDTAWQSDKVLQINFEIDDQTPEDISIAINGLRQLASVKDIVQWPVFSKKGRLATSIQILCELAAEQTVIAACFNQFTTLGLRKQIVSRAILPRDEQEIHNQEKNSQDINNLDIMSENVTYTVKTAIRPNGEITAKLEADDVLAYSKKGGVSQTKREALRQKIQHQIRSDNAAKNNSNCDE